MQNAMVVLVEPDGSERRTTEFDIRAELKAAVEPLAFSGRDAPDPSRSVAGAASSNDRDKPELSGALEAVARAADLIRVAQERTNQAEERSARFADHAAEQISAADDRARQAQAETRAMEEQLRSVIEMCKAQVTEADRRTADAEAGARQTEQSARERLEHARREVEDATRRAEIAEQIARETRADIAYLDKVIREQFQVLSA